MDATVPSALSLRRSMRLKGALSAKLGGGLEATMM
jgi:hypothetical protein